MATVTEAEGLAELELWQDAWDALEELPVLDRATPGALRVRLACCPALAAWDIGRQVAAILRVGEEPDRKAAARFFHAVALKWLSEGDRYAAGEAIKEAVKTWPDYRNEILDHSGLSEAL